MPLPHYVFPNLAKRWEGIAPPELAGIVQRRLIEDYTLEDGVIITDYDLHPHRIHFTRHVQQGFVGRCTYRVHDAQSGLIANDDADEGDRESARSPLSIPQQLWLLSQLAFYTGIGYKTSMGMGRAQTV